MESQQNKPLPQSALRISDPCAALRRATRAVTHLYDLVLSPTGLKATQFVILQAIHTRGEIAQWRLAAEYGIGEDTLSRRLAVLRNAGLVCCRAGAERSGEKLYRLTEAGVNRYEQTLPAWVRAQERLRAIMGSEQWELLLRMSEQVVATARQAEEIRYANGAPANVYAACAGEGAAASTA